MYGHDSGAYVFGQLFGIIIAAVIAVLVAKDANARGMNGILWGIFTFFLCIIALPIYLVVRKPRLDGGA
ncbi:MAG: hypothetical protein JO276_00260 [Sphingomonadaceae bacterium]|nr:hypothetical protein [Sphingomonadaceae bacterium]